MLVTLRLNPVVLTSETLYSAMAVFDHTVADMGYVTYFNTRQRAVDQAKRDTPDSSTKVWHLAECNHLPHPVYTAREHYIVDSVFPYISVDAFGLSSWSTNKDNESELQLPTMFDLIKANTKPSAAFGRDNVMLTEFGCALNGIFNGDQDAARGALARQVEMMLKYGNVNKLTFWAMLGSDIRNGGDPTVPVTDGSNLVGNLLILPDGAGGGVSTRMAEYMQSIMSREIAEYKDVYEAENQIIDSQTNAAASVSDVDASGVYYLELKTAAVTDEITFKIQFVQLGTYRIVVGLRRSPDGGIFDVDLDGDVLGSFDAYDTDTANGFVPLNLAQNATITDVSVPHLLGFTVTGQTQASTGFNCQLDYIRTTVLVEE